MNSASSIKSTIPVWRNAPSYAHIFDEYDKNYYDALEKDKETTPQPPMQLMTQPLFQMLEALLQPPKDTVHTCSREGGGVVFGFYHKNGKHHHFSLCKHHHFIPTIQKMP